MIRVRVIRAEGAAISGPVTLKLSRAQWARRSAILGPVPDRLRRVSLEAGASLTFKRGEEIEIDTFEGKLSPALFERLTPAPAAETADAEAALLT